MKVKLLNTDLIRTFGGVVVNMSDSQAMKYIHKGLAKAYRDSDLFVRRTSKQVPPEDKNIWIPPEQKLFKTESDLMKPYPDINDKLFDTI